MEQTNKQETLNALFDAVCKVTEINGSYLKGPSRNRQFADARHLFYHLTAIQPFHTFTYKEVGDFLNRDHATVLAGRRKALELLQYDKGFQRNFRKLSTHFNLINYNIMSATEKQAIIDLKEAQIEELKKWLGEHVDNPYRTKVQSDIRELEAEVKALQDKQQNAA